MMKDCDEESLDIEIFDVDSDDDDDGDSFMLLFRVDSFSDDGHQEAAMEEDTLKETLDSEDKMMIGGNDSFSDDTDQNDRGDYDDTSRTSSLMLPDQSVAEDRLIMSTLGIAEDEEEVKNKNARDHNLVHYPSPASTSTLCSHVDDGAVNAVSPSPEDIIKKSKRMKPKEKPKPMFKHDPYHSAFTPYVPPTKLRDTTEAKTTYSVTMPSSAGHVFAQGIEIVKDQLARTTSQHPHSLSPRNTSSRKSSSKIEMAKFNDSTSTITTTSSSSTLEDSSMHLTINELFDQDYAMSIQGQRIKKLNSEYGGMATKKATGSISMWWNHHFGRSTK